MTRTANPLASLAYLLLAVICCAGAIGSAQADEQLIELPTRPGVMQPFYLTRAPAPIAALVLFTGGDGRLLNYGPASPDRGNFLVRSRDLFVEQGFTVAVIDVPSDQKDGLDGFRLSPNHASDIIAVVNWLRADAKAPVWLVGTSRGTISAALGAAHASDLIAGLVLTSSLTREPKRRPGTVMHAGLGKVTVPTLVVSHRQDACFATPPGDGSEILDALTKVRHKDFLLVDGGLPARSEPCEAFAAHGFLGIERDVVKIIGGWIKQIGPPAKV